LDEVLSSTQTHITVRIPSRLLLVFGLCLAACHEPTAVAPLAVEAGRYAVVSVNGTALPTLIVDSPTLHISLLADTLVVANDGTGTWVSTFRWSSEIDPPTVVQTSVPITVRKESGVFLLRQIPCPAGVECEVPQPAEVHVRKGELEATARFATYRWRRVAALP